MRHTRKQGKSKKNKRTTNRMKHERAGFGPAIKRLLRDLEPYGIKEPTYAFTIEDKYHIRLPANWPLMRDTPIIINDIGIPYKPSDHIKDIIDGYIETYENKPLMLIYCHDRPITNIEEHQCFKGNSPLIQHIPVGHKIVTLDIQGIPNILVKDPDFIERNKGRFAGLFILDCLMWHKGDENNPQVPLKVIKETLPLVKSGGYAIYTVLPEVMDAVIAEVGGEVIEDPNTVACYKKYLKILIP
jgi:hypothetical protein